MSDVAGTPAPVRLTTRPHVTIDRADPLAAQILNYDRALAHIGHELARRATRLAHDMTRLADTATAAAAGQPHHVLNNRGEVQGNGPGIDLLCARLVDTASFLDALLTATHAAQEHHPTATTEGH